MIKLKRAYAPAEAGDGVRYLVDRVWPRGVTREAIAVKEWLREAAPSDILRQWFGHDPAKWDEFRQRYFAELEEKPAVWQPLLAVSRQGTLTLVFSARDEAHNQAAALKEFLDKKE